MVGVPGCGHDPHLQSSGCALVAVGHRVPVELDLVRRGDQISGAGAPGRLETSGDVVVVDVGLHHQHAAHSPVGQDLLAWSRSRCRSTTTATSRSCATQLRSTSSLVSITSTTGSRGHSPLPTTLE
jgi:hypothetical protein